MYPELVQIVVDFIDEVKEMFPENKCDGLLGYYNGNDGTDFDWDCNGRLCEFGYGVIGDDIYSFKCLVYTDGSAEVYCYPNGEGHPVKTVEKQIMTEEDADKLRHIMYYSTDAKMNWNALLSDISWYCF